MNEQIRTILRITMMLVIPLLVAAATYLVMRNLFFEPVNPANKELVLVEVRPEKPFRIFCKELEEKGLVKHWRVLELLARARGQDTQIKAGEYQLSQAMSPLDILAKLASGDVFLRKVTIKEGAAIRDMGPLFEAAGVLTADEFEKAAYSAALLVRAGINAESFEGYLFPETYFFSRTDSVMQIIWRMMEEGEKNWQAEFTTKADQLNLSRHEVLTLASIIEKESGNLDELPIISSVFHNRLANGMKLQSDPTVIYGLKNFDGNIRKEDLQNPHPYNTYVHFGLPPGPICSPGLNAIKATLYPAQTNYLFFVADGTGKHVFSATLKEHNEAVKRYQLGQGGASAGAAPEAAPEAAPSL